MLLPVPCAPPTPGVGLGADLFLAALPCVLYSSPARRNGRTGIPVCRPRCRRLGRPRLDYSQETLTNPAA